MQRSATQVEPSIQYAPRFGAIPLNGGARFQVWAPAARSVDVVFDDAGAAGVALARDRHGCFSAFVPRVAADTRYRYRLNGHRLLPDPASRRQPDGVHGSSAFVDPSAFAWTDAAWRGIRAAELVVYELHVGTFTSEGTFAGVEPKLPALAELGITAIELMPVAEFAGRWNWGYDGVALYAPSHNYGSPDDLRRLVDAAHAHGLAVLIDVVYNHFGPDGAYIHEFSPLFRTHKHQTPWGDGVNLDGEQSELVRAFLVENALHWVHEYHVDGLRVDAAHALQDDSPQHFLAELASTVRSSVEGREIVMMAEDERNLAALVTPAQKGGYGFDAVWADDFHHQVRRIVAGDDEGYFRSYSASTQDLARTIARGWFFTGQYCAHTGAPRGSDPAGLPLERFVFCVQNHDQIGNRASGERLHHQIEPEVYRAVSALLLLAPEAPLLFMGQEWAASSPFLFFTDHHEELGRAITEGRREEFASFSAFADADARQHIPDPQAEDTFRRSRLNWDERRGALNAGILRLYKQLLQLRRGRPRRTIESGSVDVRALDDATVMWRLPADPHGASLQVVVRLKGGGTVIVDDTPRRAGGWRTVLTTEDEAFAAGGRPPVVDTGAGLTITFECPAAVVLLRDPR